MTSMTVLTQNVYELTHAAVIINGLEQSVSKKTACCHLYRMAPYKILPSMQFTFSHYFHSTDILPCYKIPAVITD